LERHYCDLFRMINYRILAVLSLAVLGSALGQGLVVPLLPLYAQTFGAGGFAIGMIFGAFSISRTVFLPVFGRLSDRKGRKPFITFGLFCYFVTSIAYIYADSVSQLFVTRFMQGIAAAMVFPVVQAYGGQMAPDGREGFVMGFVNFGFYLGLSLGPVLGGFVKDRYGMDAAFKGMGIVCFFGFLVSLLFLPSRKSERSMFTARKPEGFRVLMRDVSIAALFLARLGQLMCVGTLWTFLPVLADRQYRMSSSATGVVITLIVALSTLVMPAASILADRWNKRRLVVAGCCLIIVGLLLLVLVDRLWAVYAAAILAGIGGGIATPAQTGMAAVLGKQHSSLGSIMSLLSLGHSLGMFFGPVFTGATIDFLGIKAGFVVSATILAVTIAVFYPLTSRYHEM